MQKQEITPQNSLYSLLTRNSNQWNCSEKRLESAVQKVLNCCFVQVPFFLSLTHNCFKWHDLNWKHMFMDSFWRLGWPLRTLSGLTFWHWSILNSSNYIMSLRNETSLLHFKKLMSNFFKLIHCYSSFTIIFQTGLISTAVYC